MFIKKKKKALYGLKQTPRLWSKYMTNALKELGFTVFPYDEGIYINKQTLCIIICHVDDNLYIKGYSDSDWGNDLDDRKSTSGYIFSLSGDIGINNPIRWASQLQLLLL